MDDCSVFAGLDYHQASVQVCVVNRPGDVLLNRRCRNDWRAVVKTVESCGVPVFSGRLDDDVDVVGRPVGISRLPGIDERDPAAVEEQTAALEFDRLGEVVGLARMDSQF
mgnify:CR=1 FL=1